MARHDATTRTRGRRSGRKPPPRAAKNGKGKGTTVDTAEEIELDDDNEDNEDDDAATAAGVEPADLSDDEDDDGDDDEGDDKGTGSKGRGNAKHAGQPAHIRKAAVFTRLADKISVTVHGKKGTKSVEMDGWIKDDDLDKAKALADEGIAKLREASEILEGKGPDFVPTPKRTRARTRLKLNKGAKCRIKDKYRGGDDGYDDLMETDEMDNLTFHRKAGTKLVFTTPDGGKLFLRRHEIEVVAEGEGDDEGGDEDE